MQTNKKSKQLIYVVLFLFGAFIFGVFLYFIVLWASFDYQANFIKQERCIQSGGVWSISDNRCWYAGQCEDLGGFWYPIEKRCVYDVDTIKLK
ncbi:MAG: hypothetical protein ACKKL4_00830 [Patescibacteria group bacterium]